MYFWQMYIPVQSPLQRYRTSSPPQQGFAVSSYLHGPRDRWSALSPWVSLAFSRTSHAWGQRVCTLLLHKPEIHPCFVSVVCSFLLQSILSLDHYATIFKTQFFFHKKVARVNFKTHKLYKNTIYLFIYFKVIGTYTCLYKEQTPKPLASGAPGVILLHLPL